MMIKQGQWSASRPSPSIKTDIADITSQHIGIKGLHSNFTGTTQLAKNFANVIKKI